MEDYQEQEYEFWRRLDEETVDRRRLLKRGLVAGAGGLTILSLSEPALAARAKALADPPLKGTPGTMKELVAQAKKEGHLNDIALPDDWANYGQIIKTFQKRYGTQFSRTNPGGSSAAENQAIVSLKGDPRAPDCVDVTVAVALEGVKAGSVRTVLRQQLQDDPARNEGHARLLDGRLLGRESRSATTRGSSARRRRRSRTC